MAEGSDRRPGWLDVIAGGEPTAGADADTSPAALRAAIAETREELARHLGALKHHLFHPHLSNPESETETDMATTKKKPAVGGASKSHATAKSSAASAKGRAPAASPPTSQTPKANADRKQAAAPPKAKAKASPSNPTRPASASSTKPAKSSASPKSGRTASASASKPKAKASRKPAVKSLMEKTGEVLDTLVAGAVVGAITGAAQSVAQEPTAVTPAEPQALASSPAAVGGPGTKEVLGELASGAAVGAVSGAAKSVLPAEKTARATAKKSAPKKKSSKG